jgi:hypothetical protein
MKHVIFAGIMAAMLATGAAPASAQSGSKAAMSLGSVTINHKVSADGKALPTGTYQIRLTTDEPKPAAIGQSPESERYVEFVRGGKVVAREVATVVSNADVATLVKGPKPANGAVRVDVLKGNDYVRVWINKGGQNYLIHLPSAA